MIRTALLVVLTVFALSTTSAFTLVDKGSAARIVVGSSEPEHVWLAAVDLTNDVRRISDRALELVRADRPVAGDVFIATDPRPQAWEAYSVAEKDGVLRMSGSDDRGTMFAVYDFIERYLGVDPMGFWSGVEPKKRSSLTWKDVRIDQPSPSFRYRGWFINDEDLLTLWQNASGVRDYSNYKYYNNVVNHEVMARVAESLVRSRMNLIIPASLLNILRPAEEGLAAICSRRGIFVSMHHIEPMGVSGFTFKDYWRKRGRELEYSYFKYPREVEEVWKAAAAKWAKIPRVLWQIGLRGTGDRPMWFDDPTMPKDDAGRAKLISDALARQVEILDEIGVPKEGRCLTTTLWAEGAYFNERGLLKFPQGTMIVFADNNCGWKWPKDLMEGRRDPAVDYGVYYHHQLIGMGPHLAPLVPAWKTHEMLTVAQEKGAGTYAIFNVGNIREFVYNLDATSKMTWNLKDFDAESWTKEWLVRRVPSAAEAWLAALNVYHRSLQLNPPTGIPCFLDGQMSQNYRSTITRIRRAVKADKVLSPAPEPMRTVYRRVEKDDPFHASLGDTHPPLASPSDTYMRLAGQRAGYEQTLDFARRALEKTAKAERTFARDHLLYPAVVMAGMTAALMDIVQAEEALLADERTEAIGRLEAAVAAWRALIAAGEEYCHDKKWENWYRGCEKVSPRLLLRQTLETLELLN